MGRCILAYLHQLLALRVNNLFQLLSLITDDNVHFLAITVCTFLREIFLVEIRDKGPELLDPPEPENSCCLPPLVLPACSAQVSHLLDNMVPRQFVYRLFGQMDTCLADWDTC